MRRFLAAAAILATAACSETAPTVPGDDASVTEVAEELAQADTPATIAIPAVYQGVWDYEGGTCKPESDMRMEVTGADITYYESYGKVTGTRPEGDDLIVDLAMEGEGDQWNESQRLSLVGSGTARRIHVTNGDLPKTEDEYPRKFCS